MKHLLTIFFFTLFSHLSLAQADAYATLWKQVEHHELEGLITSALEDVERIEIKAKAEDNHSQIIKVLLYKSKFALVLEEDAQLKIIDSIKTQITESAFPSKNILESILANLYWQYFKNNRWQFYNRTQVKNVKDNADFRTWDLQSLFDAIHVHYQNSLKNGLMLQQEKLETYEALLNEQKDSKIFRPTLFDFLSHAALDFYKTSETHITKPSYKFEIDNDEYMADAERFSTLNITSKDTTSLQLNALKIYKSLVRFHLKNKKPLALTDVNLERLKFVHNHATFSNKKDIFIDALKQERASINDTEAASLYDFEIASTHFNQSKTYHPKNNQEHRWKAKEAIDLCNAVISKSPDGFASKNCKILKAQIERPSLTITTEKFLPTQKHARLLVQFKNIDSIQFIAYKLSDSQYKKYKKSYRAEDQKALFKKLNISKSWITSLRNEGDYQIHNTEILIPKLSNGRYLIVAYQNKSQDYFAISDIQVTNIALAETETLKHKIFQVINRNNGKPLSESKIGFSYYSQKLGQKVSQDLRPNELGEIKIEKDDSWYNDVKLKVVTGSDTAYFGDYYINKKYPNSKKRIDYKAFLFTDRSIYRPGQTVYFKAIALKSKNGKSEVIPNKLFYLDVYDVNDDDVISLELKTNDFGSISGEFVLPSSGLNGEYYINLYADSNAIDIDTDYRFSVEEYKRPKFEASFSPIKDTFKVNDSITISGNAKAYAGSQVTNAKVVYRIHRKVQYPEWYYWYRPWFQSEPQEISFGETKTNNSGQFELTFKAIPDTSIDPTTLPIFNYEVIADITDLNGETRRAKSTVKVGYHALMAKMTLDNIIDKSTKNYEITVSTKNLNDEFVPAKGSIKIYKLKAPNTVLRERPWPAPDYQEFSEEAFKNLFPHDPYNTEDQVKYWEKGALILHKRFDTNLSKTVKLGKLKKWPSGQYIAILESKDKFGQLVKDEIKTTFYSQKDELPADNQILTLTTDKSFYQVGDTAYVTLGSAAKFLNVTLSIEKNHNTVNTQVIQLNANKKVIAIPVTAKDMNGFALQYSYAFFNSYKSGTRIIPVEGPKTNLDIETITFRDKLQPGNDETWQFNIKGPHNEKVSAELLASMYDLSLDQFKPHKWAFSPTYNLSYTSHNKRSAYSSFGTRNFRGHSNYQRFSYPQRSYDEFNWFGFSLVNNIRVNDLYLIQIRNKRSAAFHKNIAKGFISGTIYDESGLPLPGVNIMVKGSTIGTSTDFDGNFAIKAKKDDEIEISYLGFKNQAIKVNSNHLNITLKEDSASLEEVVVVGYGTQKKSAITGSVSTVRSEYITADASLNALAGKVSGIELSQVSGAPENIKIKGSGTSSKSNPLFIVDGKIVEGELDLDSSDIESIDVLKDASATAIYGTKGANGVVIITTKSGLNAFTQMPVRKNLQETAFFYPNLKTDASSTISFSFTTPEALTKWKLQLLAHTKTLESAIKTLNAVTQKELMVIPNTPRFLREGDNIRISTKIANLTDTNMNGSVILLLTDAISGDNIDTKLGNVINNKRFDLSPNGNTQVSWSLSIPKGIQAIQYKIIAKTENFSDGEQNVLPVLSNRTLVTETLPMWVRSNETRSFTLDKLKTNNSKTLKHHKLTLEITSNPAWYAIQALPYLMEYPYQCNEQTFSRYYANAFASHIANSNPRIKEVFNQWRSNKTLISKLEKNPELKSILIQETPWIRDAQSETEQKKRIALLFDLNKMNQELLASKNKLKSNQLSSGGWSWFNGGKTNRYITQHIVIGFGHLKHLGINTGNYSNMLDKAIRYLDAQFIKEYNDLKTNHSNADLNKDHLSHYQIHYLYMRSFFPDIKKSKELEGIIAYYQTQIKKFWLKQSLYSKGMMALIANRNKDIQTSSKILKSLLETSITSKELGMYWKSNSNSWYWYQAPVETQALLVEAFSEAGKHIMSDARLEETTDNLKIWLLKNKQTNQWKTTKATTEAIYAMLLQGADWLSVTEMVEVSVANKKIEPTKLEQVQVEARTGYYKTSWSPAEINADMANVKLSKKTPGIAWGSLYWQYFEDLDKITSSETPLSLKKKLFLKKNTDLGEELKEITPQTQLQVGDLVTVRIELKSDRTMEFLHMKDMRASGLEPVNVLSSYKWQDGLGYYESTKDASTNFFFNYLPKGVYIFEYDLRVNNSGDMSNGITSIQSMYAPEYSSHSEGSRIHIETK
ncbi:alpha-2-macroglobulin family protein [Cognatitamlana onchidii]|uniref:alpha-2-macroglobulin family protein n=1 Tax=Cognatitamlana onchidii TaxID=2562860 RepID=UPI0014560F37|nr:carboxypeptidase-like regulatory domain-containing protein [Algibacter onchidii]